MKSMILSMTSEMPWPSFSPVFCPDLTICSPSSPMVEGRFSPSASFSRNPISFEFKGLSKETGANTPARRTTKGA